MNTDLDERYQGVNYDLELPDTIRLPDGREFNVPELLSQCRRDHIHGTVRSLKKNPERRIPQGRFNAKYTPEEIAWLLTADIDAVAARYQVDHKRALAILRYAFSKVGRIYKSPTRKIDRRTLAKLQEKQ